MITKCPYLCGPDVLFHPDCTTKSIKLDYTSVTDGVIKGGSPINAEGRVANDATAIGVLRRDCYEGYHPRGQVIIGGYVRQDIAQENSGIALADAAKAVMAKVLFVNSSGVPQPGVPAGGVTTLHINVTAVNMETMEATFTADKTPLEMQEASATGPIWCVVTIAAGIMGPDAVSFGVPPAWHGGSPAFGSVVAFAHDGDGNNETNYVVQRRSSDLWLLDVTQLGG